MSDDDVNMPRRIGQGLAMVTFAIAEVIGWIFYARHPSPALGTALSIPLGIVAAYSLPIGLRKLDQWLIRRLR